MKPISFSTTLARSQLVVNDYSRPIFKQKPKIRIIHIVEPEIIKTDVQNFQALVQRLTGKPVERKGNTNSGTTASSRILDPKPCCRKPESKTESECALISQDTQRSVKEEIEEIYNAKNENALSSFLGELDGFLHDMNEYPLFGWLNLECNNKFCCLVCWEDYSAGLLKKRAEKSKPFSVASTRSLL